MLLVEDVRRHSKVDVAYLPDGTPTLVEVYRTGRVRPLDRATAFAVSAGNVGLVRAHYVRKGAAVSSRLRLVLQ